MADQLKAPHLHWSRVVKRGHRPGGSDDDVEIKGEVEVCVHCGEVREAPTARGPKAVPLLRVSATGQQPSPIARK